MTNININFRYAEKDDLPKIVDIYNQAIPTRQSTADLIPVTVEERNHWFNAHTINRRPIWVITYGYKIVGWISLEDFHQRAAYCNTAEISIYIDHAYRGRAIAKQALMFVEEQRASLGIETILAFIFAHNIPSKKLFYSFGFERMGYFPGIAELDGVKRDLDILGKKYE